MDTDKNADKIYCANCEHCVVIKVPAGIGSKYLLRVKCIQNKWKKKLGEEKFYKYFTVARRIEDECGDYSPMGDNIKGYLRDLRKSLPIKDEVYEEDRIRNGLY
jgi:hypothetical protein